MKCLLAFRPEELRQEFAAEGLPRFRAAQVLHQLYSRGERDLAGMTDLPAALPPLVAMMLARDPAARPTAAEASSSLGRLLAQVVA